MIESGLKNGAIGNAFKQQLKDNDKFKKKF